MKVYSAELFKEGSNNVFVFGSNLAGIHGAGAAQFAYQELGFPLYQGEGLAPNKKAYAFPTKGYSIQTLPLYSIKASIVLFYNTLINNEDLTFYMSRVGCGLAGYKDSDIAPLFKRIKGNIIYPTEWEEYL